MSHVDELVQSRTVVWIAAAACGGLTIASIAASGGWFLVLANSRMLPLVGMVAWCGLQVLVTGTATWAMVRQGRAIEALREDAAAPGAIEEVVAGRTLLWQALAVGAWSIIALVGVAMPLYTSVFWR